MNRFLGKLSAVFNIADINRKKAAAKKAAFPKDIFPIGTYGNGKGNVYVIPDHRLKEVMDTKDKHSVVVVDRRASSDPNMQIQQSYAVLRGKYKKEIARLLLDYDKTHPGVNAWKRTVKSIVSEWIAHNVAYRFWINRAHTGDCDFNNDDEGKKFWELPRKHKK